MLAVVCSVAACEAPKTDQTPRAELKKLTGNTFELVPAEGQYPYCLAFTQSQAGVMRQLTMTHENKSMRCVAGEPIGKVSYRVPINEGRVKVHIFFSDQKLDAGSIARQLYEHKGDPSFNPLDLRLPGSVFVHSIPFTPTQEDVAKVGGEIGAGGEIQEPADAGTNEAPPEGGGAVDPQAP